MYMLLLKQELCIFLSVFTHCKLNPHRCSSLFSLCPVMVVCSVLFLSCDGGVLLVQ